MRIKCEFCDSFIDDSDEKCPYCGAVNNNLARSGSGIPKTIEELRAFANSHHLPLDEMHYYLGENYKGPKAIGIYKDDDTGNFVVYKNKSDGSRAVRYEGKDEAYAVNEVYQKMHTDVMNRKAQKIAGSNSQTSSSSHSSPSTSGGGFKRIILYIAIAMIVLLIFGRSCGGCIMGSAANSFFNNNYGSGYTQDYDYGSDYGSDYSSDYGSDYGSSDWDDDSNDSWWSDDSWDSSDWDWDSGDSWDFGDSDWDSDW